MVEEFLVTAYIDLLIEADNEEEAEEKAAKWLEKALSRADESVPGLAVRPEIRATGPELW